MQPRPDAELRKRPRERHHVRFVPLLAPQHLAVANIAAVSAGVLRDNEQLAHAAGGQRFGLPHDVIERSTDQTAA